MSNEQLFFGLSQVLRKFPKETGEQIKRHFITLFTEVIHQEVNTPLPIKYVLPFIQIEYYVTSALSQRKLQMRSWVLIMLERAKC